MQRATYIQDLPYGNAPVLRHLAGGLTIEGYSRAAVQTYWRVGEWKILFDMGELPWEFAKTPCLALTHVHIDHSAAVIRYVASRSLLGMPPPTIYLPHSHIEDFEDLLKVWRKLTGTKLPCTLQGCQPADKIDLGRNRMLECLRAVHSIEALGYLLVSGRRKLKPSYQDLSSSDLSRLRARGAEITTLEETLEVAYLGDTSIQTLEENPRLFEAKILILELTFLGGDMDGNAARRLGHMHIDHLLGVASEFRNDTLILSHISTRWTPSQALAIISETLPPDLAERVVVWL